jgi:hypothetical protein
MSVSDLTDGPWGQTGGHCPTRTLRLGAWIPDAQPHLPRRFPGVLTEASRIRPDSASWAKLPVARDSRPAEDRRDQMRARGPGFLEQQAMFPCDTNRQRPAVVGRGQQPGLGGDISPQDRAGLPQPQTCPAPRNGSASRSRALDDWIARRAALGAGSDPCGARSPRAG